MVYSIIKIMISSSNSLCAKASSKASLWSGLWRFGLIYQGALQGSEADTQNVSPQLIGWLFCAELSARAAYGFDSAAPVLNETGAIENICDIRIIRDGVVRLHQRVHCPALRQNTPIADDYRRIFDIPQNDQLVRLWISEMPDSSSAL